MCQYINLTPSNSSAQAITALERDHDRKMQELRSRLVSIFILTLMSILIPTLTDIQLSSVSFSVEKSSMESEITELLAKVGDSLIFQARYALIRLFVWCGDIICRWNNSLRFMEGVTAYTSNFEWLRLSDDTTKLWKYFDFILHWLWVSDAVK